MSGVCGEGQAERLVVPGWVTVHLKVRLFALSPGSEDPAAEKVRLLNTGRGPAIVQG
jgi:hypothetical protein